MTMTVRLAACLAAVLGLAATAAAADQLAATLRGVVEENLRAYDAEDVAATMRSVHTRSPAYAPTQAELADQFRDLDLIVKLVDFTYMGHDDEFALARVKIAFTAPPESPFVNNTTDSIELFHQEGGIWKLWTDEILGVAFEPRSGTADPPK